MGFTALPSDVLKNICGTTISTGYRIIQIKISRLTFKWATYGKLITWYTGNHHSKIGLIGHRKPFFSLK